MIMEGNGQTRWYEGNFTGYGKAVVAENPRTAGPREEQVITGWLSGLR